MRLFAFAHGAAVLAFTTGAAADPPAEGALAPPPVTLSVTPASQGAPWQLRVENAGDAPVRIPADVGLLTLEVTPPAPEATAKKAKKVAPVTCTLPSDARPSSDEGRELVIPAGRSWSATFDPLFFCFGARERRALVPGSQVKARFGFRPPTSKAAKAAPKPPFAVTPVGAAVGALSPAKMIEAEAFTLAERPSAGQPVEEDTSAPPRDVTLSVPEAMDAARGVELATRVTLTNQSDRARTLLFRPDMVELRVTGPNGSVWCGAPRVLDAPIRELFRTVAAKGKLETSILLTSSCPPGTFDEPAVYEVLPQLDTTQASGREIGLATWEGVATSVKPLLVRVRTPKIPAPLPRPTLD